ncbi:MAG: glycerophosphodiester phosphodiesterase family protein [Alphaproteobacteria bacterium]
MPLKLPKIIAHRGASAYAPENTLESLHSAADLGIEWVELDVKLTKDNVPIIFHDDNLQRTTGLDALVAQTDYKIIKDLDAGSWFGDSFIGAKIPTLEEAVNVLIAQKMGLNLEIKSCPGREKETAEIVLDQLSQIWDDHDRILLSSFNHVSLETAMDMAHDWHRGFLLDEQWPENWRELVEYFNAAAIALDGNTVTRNQVEDIIDLGKPVLAYTINDPMKARELQSWGVDSFFSDEPDVIAENLLTVH